MIKYIVKRLGSLGVVLVGTSIVVFALVHLQPGNPYSTMINPNVSPERFEAMLREVGYYDPLYVQYAKWAGRALKGDLGYSIQYKAPVLALIGERLGNTIGLALIASLIGGVLAIPFGIISASKKYSLFDYLVTGLSFLGISIPSFFLGMLLIKWFSFDLQWLPASGMKTVGTNYRGWAYGVDLLKHLIMPAVVLSFLNLATLMRYTRSAMLDVIGQDFIRTAQGKGLTWGKAVWRHGFKNALIPIITIVCMQIPFLFSGALITETIFVWPGIGRLNYEAILARDYPLIMGILMVSALIIIVSNLLADILYALADPRIRYGGEWHED